MGGISLDQPKIAMPPLRPDAAQATRLASIIVTFLPAKAKRKAVCKPENPAPIITISVSISPCCAARCGAWQVDA